MNAEDTIVAIATPAGRGGLGVVRLSGPESRGIAEKVLRCAPPATPANPETDFSASAPPRSLALRPWRIRYAELPDEHGEVIDRVLVSYFRRPRSYTAEDVVEISCHGAPVVLQYLVSCCLRAGARLAEPGEFTLRAFLNGRIDLTQAEAVRDLIEAQTLYQAKVAAQQMEGAIARQIAPLKKQLVELISLLEAGIDFAEDDVSVLSGQQIRERLQPIETGAAQLTHSFATGRMIHHGLTLAIVGRPNVGKSSLFNCLLEQDRAIVTATPGTTRDLVSETVELEGIPLRFVDTAGMRAAFDEAESIGIRKSREAAADSDLALVVLDGSEGLAPEDRDLLERLYSLDKLLLVVNKCDLPQRLQPEALQMELTRLARSAEDGLQRNNSVPVQCVSALRREGIPELRRAILQTAAPALVGHREAQFLTNIRQETHLRESLTALGAARQGLLAKVPHEVLLLDLYAALRPLDAITGETTVEDILTNIFSTFCIGK